jgi:aspartate/methionine/tyrosine aminotransferase
MPPNTCATATASVATFLSAASTRQALSAIRRGGSFYAFPSVASTGLDEGTFARRLLTEHKVAVVPGTAFGDAGQGHVRACFTANEEKLSLACDKIERLLNSLKAPAVA